MPIQRRTIVKALSGTSLGALALGFGYWWSNHENSEVRGSAGTSGPQQNASHSTDVVPAAKDAVVTLFGLSFKDADGMPVAMAKYQGKPLILNFWATWCAPCVEEMPELSQWQQESGDKLNIVGIGIDSADNVRKLAAKNKYQHQLIAAGTGGLELARLFGNAAGGLPFTVVISPRSSIEYRVLGRFEIAKLKSAIS